jgi:hypothetical protein
MKNIKILIIAMLLATMAKAQISLLYICDSSSTIVFGSNTNSNQLMMINFAVSGERYVNINREGKYISIYDLNHSLLKKISYAGFPLDYGNFPQFLYISQNLFSSDTKIDFMYCFSPTSTTFFTNIYNEDGVILFSDTGSPIVNASWAMQQWPIFNTSQGTEMILSYSNGQAKIFSLPGTLTSGIQEANNNLMAIQAGRVSNAYPNPNNGSTKIDYTLPPGVNEGEIVFYNLMGNEVNRFKVDRTFNTLLISTKDIAAGTYYYQLQTAGESSGGKKMVVIK